MIILFKDKDANGSIWWRERVIPLEGVFLIRMCEKNLKVEVNYKAKPKEDLMCTEAEVADIIEQLKGV
jgi:hypothetical protein